ncbi:MAG: HlyC/CorC family transporter [Chloroflexi bacterium]|nr:HlyC/CorC family transporter [Chloroflexota bacterium]
MDTLVSTGLSLLAIIFLVFANGFFVATEFSLVSVRRTRIEQLASEGHRLAIVVQQALTHLDDYIAATQLGITMASLALGWIGEPALAHLIEPLLHFLPTNLVGLTAHSLAVAIAFSLITTLHIVLGELAPKTIALQRAEHTALAVATPIDVFLRIFRPFINLMNGLGRWVVELIGLHPTVGHEAVHSSEELQMLVAASTEAGVMDKEEQEMLQGVFQFADLSVNQIMTPRNEIIGIESTATIADLMRIYREEPHERFPVYEGDLDRIKGMITIKDVMLALSEDPQVLNDPLRDSVRPVLIAPETRPITVLLPEMRRARTQMAIIIDEYGGTAGIVTLGDLIEEIFGEVGDEVTGESTPIQTIDETAFQVNAHLRITEINEMLKLQLPESNLYETLAGFILLHLQRIPKEGDHFKYDTLRFEIVQMKGPKIEHVLIRQQ